VIAGSLKVLVKVMVAAGVAAVVLTTAGDFQRQLVPEAYELKESHGRRTRFM
jgi:hypothetical protein